MLPRSLRKIIILLFIGFATSGITLNSFTFAQKTIPGNWTEFTEGISDNDRRFRTNDKEEGHDVLRELTNAINATLTLHKHEVFVGEPCYYSLAISPEGKRLQPDMHVNAGLLVMENTEQKPLYFEIRGGRGMGYGKARWRETYEILLPGIRQSNPYLDTPGKYSMRAWISGRGFLVSSQEQLLEVREPNEDERRSLEFLLKMKSLETSYGTSRVSDETLKELENHLATEMDVPLREELELAVAQQLSIRMPKVIQFEPDYVASVQKELAIRSHMPTSKPWLRWLAYAEGKPLRRYLPKQGNSSLKAIDWEAVNHAWSENSPVLPQILKADLEAVEQPLIDLKAYVEEHRVGSSTK